MNRIQDGTILTGEMVDLIPLDERYFAQLHHLAVERRIWEFIPIDMSTHEKREAVFVKALSERDAGTQFPFVIFHKAESRVIGSTRLMNIEPAHNKLEIGWTWLHPDHWASAVNPECKLLLLTFCFEQLKAVRVQLKTDENNIRSRKAIEKIGAKFEGILRYDMIRDNGTNRNSAYFSIINSEWKDAKVKLQTLYRAKQI